MDEYNNNQYPWDDSVYGTGRTEPPKSRGGIVAVLLILVIFLTGIITVLGILNVRLFQQLSRQEQAEDISISFASTLTEPETVLPTVAESCDPLPEDAARDSFLSLQESPQSPANYPEEGGLSLQDIYQKNIPSVVSILCRNRNGTTTGTGVVLTQDGYIVTNAHVVEGAEDISVRLSGDQSCNARLIGADEVSDLAVLLVEATGLTPAEFGNSDSLRVGDTVTAIGDPLGMEFRGTYTDGIVSAINRDVALDGRTMTLIQTNAALNSGNSGGPLINCYGQVIGINTMKVGAFTDQAGVEGLGFAIPSTTVKEIVDQIIRQGYVSGRPTLGIQGETLDTFYQYYYRLPAGLYITAVETGSYAAYYGIEPGDILISLDDSRVTSMSELKSVLYGYQVGDVVTVTVYRRGQTAKLDLTLTEDRG